MIVCVKEALSEIVTCGSAVQRGMILVPMLFKVYNNDLPSVLRSNCLMYAVDIKIRIEILNGVNVDCRERCPENTLYQYLLITRFSDIQIQSISVQNQEG